MSAKANLLKYLQKQGIRKQEFYTVTGLSNGFLDKNDNISSQNIEIIISKYPEISLEWLITGEGNMLNTATSDVMLNNLQENKKLIPFFDDVASIGGVNSISAPVNGNMPTSEFIDAGDWFPEATSAIRHYGDSMLEYPSGCILVLKRVNDSRLIINGRNYVIETTEFRITKQLQDDGCDYILAYSSNPATYPDGRQIHSPIRIPKDTIRHIDLVIGCVTKEFYNGAVIISH